MATLISRPSEVQEKVIRGCLWTAQVLLASLFAVDGIFKLTLPIERLVESVHWVASVPTPVVRLLGAGEILGALALMLPMASRALSLVAGSVASIFALTIVAGSLATLTRGAAAGLPLDLLLVAVAGFVAWERLRGQGALRDT